MGNGTHHDPLDALLRAARRDEPDALDEARMEAQVARAIRAAKTRRTQRTVLVTGAFATLAAAAALLLVLREPEAPRATMHATVAHALPRETRVGDRLHATEDAAFTLDEDAPRARRIVLTHGAVLCDVKPLRDGDSFEVVVDAIHVRVRGTVFSVEHEPTTVRVYEGVVEVEHGDVVVRVHAGQRWQRERGVGTIDPHPLDALAREATLARRSPEAPAPTPSVTTPAAPVEAEVARERDPATGDATEEPAPLARPIPTRLVTPSATEAEGLLRQGDPTTALALAEAARARGDGSSRWALVRADALRALGRPAEAADAYDDAAQADARHRAEAGYAAASLRFRALHDAHGALRSLDASNAVASSLAERALTLRVKLLRAEGRDVEARVDATHYLERFPEGVSASFMQGVLGQPTE